MSAKILVVDDTKMFRVTYGDRLKALGYEVELAEDGVEGLRIAKEILPDLILLDLVMPGMGGLEVLKELRDDPRTKDIPIIILTSAGDEEDFKSALRRGADDFLQKTIATTALIDKKIKKLLAEREAKKSEVVVETSPFRVAIRDREYDADRLLQSVGFKRRFFCPRCEEEMVLELIPEASSNSEHKFKAYFVCSKCGKKY